MDTPERYEELKRDIAKAREGLASSADMLRDAWAELRSAASDVEGTGSLESAVQSAMELEFQSELAQQIQEAVPYQRVEETLRRVPRLEVPQRPPRGPRRGGRRIDTSALPDLSQLPDVPEFIVRRVKRIARGILRAILIIVLVIVGFSVLALFIGTDDDSSPPSTTVVPATTVAPATTLGATASDASLFAGSWRGDDAADGSTLTLTIDGESLDVTLRDDRSAACEEAFGERVSADGDGTVAFVGGNQLVVEATVWCNLAFGRTVHPEWTDRPVVFLFDRDSLTLDGLGTCFHRPELPASCDG